MRRECNISPRISDFGSLSRSLSTLKNESNEIEACARTARYADAWRLQRAAVCALSRRKRENRSCISRSAHVSRLHHVETISARERMSTDRPIGRLVDCLAESASGTYLGRYSNGLNAIGNTLTFSELYAVRTKACTLSLRNTWFVYV